MKNVSLAIQTIAIFLAILIMVLSFTACSFDPIITIYGESVHNAVKEHFENYEILKLVRFENNGKPTLHNFCIISDLQGNINIMCISYARSDGEHEEYIASETVIANNVEYGKYYSTGDILENAIIEYLLCEKKDVPDSTLQKEKIMFDGQELYFCITSVAIK